MTELGSKAQELVRAARTAYTPSGEDRARLFAKLANPAPLPDADVGNLSGSLGERALDAVRWGAAHWPVVAAPIVVSAVAMFASSGGDLHSTPVTPRESLAPTTQVAPNAQVAPAPAAADAPASLAAPVAADVAPPRARAATPAARETQARDRLREEVALLSQAQAQLHRGEAQQALATLDGHERRFPGGTLSEERAATRIRALCALGRRTEAQGRLRALASRSPRSPYLARVRESCGGQ
jgi:hypothetical protein